MVDQDSGRGVPRGDDESARPQPAGHVEGSPGRCITGQPLTDDAALGYVPLPGYSDDDVHSGFNPNTTFLQGAPELSFPIGFVHDPLTPSPVFNTVLNTQYNYSPPTYLSAALPTPSLHRAVLPFMPTSSLQFNYADADMDEIITSGSVVAVSHPDFGVQDETTDTTGNIDDELDDTEEEEGEEEALEVEPKPVPKNKEGKRKRAANAKPVEQCVKWTSKEDECLVEAWKTVSIDLITGVNQNTDTYWGRIKTTFNERKLVDPDFANINMDCDEKAV
ncbi:putative methionyl-tRNA synthetase [Hordeum vulgare]|nr:putative methionyl-tRNA synthetase [Hordeum vulgare]